MRLVGGLVVIPLWLVACGTGGGTVDASLAELVTEQERFHGSTVRAEGVLRTHDEPRHYWIEDADLNRVELVPPEAVAPHVGAWIRVEGTFTFRDDEGRRIEVEDLEVVDPGPEDASSAWSRSR